MASFERRVPSKLGTTLVRSRFARRSTGVAVFQGGWAVAQLWAFWVAPIVGALLGAAIHRVIGRAADPA